MTQIVYSDSVFTAQFPAVGASLTPELRGGFWTNGTGFISQYNYDGYSLLNLAQQTQALNLMAAHLMTLSDQVTSGGGGIVTSATIDEISVTVLAPKADDPFQYWLNLTPYGQTLLAMLSLSTAGGFYAGGRPEIPALRRPGGFWYC